jgi:hypothetical protein
MSMHRADTHDRRTRTDRTRRPAGATTTALAAVTVSVVASALLVSGATDAAFTASTTNQPNTWQAGSVVLGDDDGTTAMFDEAGLVPGDSGENCIVVTFDGDTEVDVRLFATLGTSGLEDHLDVVVEAGTGGGFGDCTGFTASQQVHAGTLASMPSSYAAAASPWSPTAAGQSLTYRFAWTLADDPAAMGEQVSATFMWEARSV